MRANVCNLMNRRAGLASAVKSFRRRGGGSSGVSSFLFYFFQIASKKKSRRVGRENRIEAEQKKKEAKVGCWRRFSPYIIKLVSHI